MKLGPVAVYRMARKLSYYSVPIFPSLLDYLNRLLFTCWIPHTCDIGKCFIAGYQGMSMVIHKNSVIGDNVHIDQCVTLGGNGTEFGAPVIGSNVYVGAGAKILGPIRVGDGCIIGANAVVLSDVPDNSIAVGVPAKVVRQNIDINRVLYHLRVPNK